MTGFGGKFKWPLLMVEGHVDFVVSSFIMTVLIFGYSILLHRLAYLDIPLLEWRRGHIPALLAVIIHLP